MKKEEILIKCKIERAKFKKTKEEEKLEQTIKKHKIDQEQLINKKTKKLEPTTPKKKTTLKRKKEIVRKKEIEKEQINKTSD